MLRHSSKIWRKRISETLKGRTISKKSIKKQIKTRLLNAKKRGYFHSKETIDKIALSHKGFKFSSNAREKMRLSHLGKPSGRKGKHHTEEAKLKNRLAHLGQKAWNKGIVMEKSHSWKGGKSFEPYSTNWTDQLKDRIRVRDNFICQECGLPELECSQRLHIHHIDYNKKNSNESNLVSLCIGCHGKTTINRKYWEVHFASK